LTESQTLPAILSHPDFWIAGSLAMALFGLSKGGFSGLSVLGLPIFALALPPMQAAAIMLPVLVMQDIVSLWAYRGEFDRQALKLLLAGAVIGTAIATVLVTLVPQAAITLLVGVIALWFAALYWFRRLRGVREAPAIRHSNAHGVFWGTICGITSFIAHAGAPPAQAHLIPLRLSPPQFAGTLSYLFAGINLIKLGPYLWLGQFTKDNMIASMALMPVAAGATILGIMLVRRIKPVLFYPLIYGLLLLVGLKLTTDALRALL
jgi:uncharacterized protein